MHSVEKGPAVQLTRHGRPVAFLISAAEYKKLSCRGNGFLRDWMDFQSWMIQEGEPLAGDDFEGLRDATEGRKLDWDDAGR